MGNHWTPWGRMPLPPRRPALAAHGALPHRPDGHLGVARAADGAAIPPDLAVGMLWRDEVRLMPAGAAQEYVKSVDHAKNDTGTWRDAE